MSAAEAAGDPETRAKQSLLPASCRGHGWALALHTARGRDEVPGGALPGAQAQPLICLAAGQGPGREYLQRKAGG